MIANFKKRQKEAKSAKMADIKSKMMLGQKLLKKGMLAKMKKWVWDQNETGSNFFNFIKTKTYKDSQSVWCHWESCNQQKEK